MDQDPQGLAPLSADSLQQIRDAEKAAVDWYYHEGEPWPTTPHFDFSKEGVLGSIEKVIRLQQTLASKLISATFDVCRPSNGEIDRLRQRVKSDIKNRWIAFSIGLKEEPVLRDRRMATATPEQLRMYEDRPAFETWTYPPPEYWSELWNEISEERQKLFDLWEPSIDRAIGEALSRYTAVLDPKQARIRMAASRKEWMDNYRPGESHSLVWWQGETKVSYNTLRKYREGTTTRQTKGIRGNIARALSIEFSMVPE